MNLFAILEQTLRIAIPYLFAAAGGVLAERAGVVSLTLEASCSPAPSPPCSAARSRAILDRHPLRHARRPRLGPAPRARLDPLPRRQIVVGIALNLLAVGTTRLFLKLIFKSSSNSGRVAGFGGEGTGALATFQNPLLWLGLAIIPILAFWIDRTPFGLRCARGRRASAAAQTLGVPVGRVRALAVAMSASSRRSAAPISRSTSTSSPTR
jgi:simple sugar transport system permease protein